MTRVPSSDKYTYLSLCPWAALERCLIFKTVWQHHYVLTAHMHFHFSLCSHVCLNRVRSFNTFFFAFYWPKREVMSLPLRLNWPSFCFISTASWRQERDSLLQSGICSVAGVSAFSRASWECPVALRGTLPLPRVVQISHIAKAPLWCGDLQLLFKHIYSLVFICSMVW